MTGHISSFAFAAMLTFHGQLVAAKHPTSVNNASSQNLRGAHLTADRTIGVVRDTEEDIPDPDIFEPAMPLDFFKNDIDPNQFEWVDPDEIKAGETTCGFLKAPLGWEVDEVGIVYPTVKVYVCVTFATKQPAPRGNLAVHCGGPGGLSACVYGVSLDFDEEIRDTYNIIGFDQRGMGRSEPTFMVDECAVQLMDNDGTLNVNFGDEKTIRAAAKLYKQRSLNCWNHPPFQLEAVQEDGTSKKYHFLEYSGTRQLAEDIERVRRIFGDQKLSVYGISYGTVVMGTYATIFPQNVNLMVLDGSVDPNSDIVSRTMDDARSKQQRLDYFIASCEFGNGQCGGVKDMRSCINDIDKMVDDIKSDFEGFLSPFAGLLEIFGFRMSKAIVMLIVINLLFGAYDEIGFICDVAAENDKDAFTSWIEESLKLSDYQEDKFMPLLGSSRNATGNATFFFDMDSESKPTSGYSPDWPFPGYSTYSTLTSVCQDMVTAQDMAFGAYDEDRYVKFFMDINEEYPGAGTQLPARHVAQWYSATYYWPNITPLPPMGNPHLKGIIAGQLYDPATPYVWTQKMRENFKSASLLTSRSVNHGIQSARESVASDQVCYKNILRYFKKGRVDFTDGKVCESDHIGKSCTIEDILNGGQCRDDDESKVTIATM